MSKPEGPETPVDQPTPEEHPLDILAGGDLDPERGEPEPGDHERNRFESDPGQRKVLPLWAVGLIALLIAGVGFVVFRYVLGDDSSSGAGCAVVTGTNEHAEVRFVGCDAGSATFRVASRKGLSVAGCAEGAYREVRTDTELLCLMPNFRAGNCYVADDADQAFEVGSCDAPEAIKVTDELANTTDSSRCPESSGLAYAEPPVVFCLAPPTPAGR
ncbi:LppU/SCO3897 family protein [Actinokineospora inagensis]|uniref:LppU/SCO3897 family protein n=1 Tax=Actinokineospora inagensis TaxID=103730 RepID=UPI000410FA69|nr:hypothetical protein [Actinokineospora inagensis]